MPRKKEDIAKFLDDIHTNSTSSTHDTILESTSSTSVSSSLLGDDTGRKYQIPRLSDLGCRTLDPFGKFLGTCVVPDLCVHDMRRV